jgi:hypothetical protein
MIQFAVTTKDGEWTVFRDAKPLAHGMSRSDAVKLAEELAYEAEKTGEDVELLVQEYTGQLKARYSGG